MTSHEHALMIRECEQGNPWLWRQCYPRIYNEPAGGCWASPKTVSLQMFASLSAYAMGDQQKMLDQMRSQQFEFLVVSHLLKHRLPIYWLTDGLASAIGKTRPNLEIPWWTTKLPVDAGVLMLPRGTLSTTKDGNVLWIGWAKLQPGVQYVSALSKQHSYEMVNGGIILVAHLEAGYFLHWNIPLDTTPERIKLTDLVDREDVVHTSFLSVEMSAEDHALATGVMHFTFLTAMALADRPALLTPGALAKKVQRRGEEPREFWTPNVLGKGYRIQGEGQAKSEHRSLILHLVRGFWREQAHGPQRALRATKWIEPYWRGGKENGTV